MRHSFSSSQFERIVFFSVRSLRVVSSEKSVGSELMARLGPFRPSNDDDADDVNDADDAGDGSASE